MQKVFVLSFAILLAGLNPVQAQVPLTGAGAGAPTTDCSPGTNASNFLARTSGLNATFTGAYCVLINWLDAKSLFALMDFVHAYSSQDTTTAQLNLISTSFPATLNGAPNFSAGNGYLGVDGSSTVYIEIPFNPSTAGGNYARNSAHISVWSLTNAASGPTGGGVIAYADNVATTYTNLFPKYNDGNLYAGVNGPANDIVVANADSTGHYIVNRSGANASQVLRNNVVIGTSASASKALVNKNTFVLVDYNGITPITGGGYRIAMDSAGASLDATQKADLCHGFNVFLTTVNGAASVC